MKTLIILGHPRIDSLCGTLAEAYKTGAREAGIEVRQLNLAALDFDLNVHFPSPNQQTLENDIKNAQALILWAEHLVFVYPTWWGSMPALLKGFLDRVLTPDFAFRTCEGGNGFQGLLNDRSGQLITTMDTPPLVYRFIYKQPGNRAMALATLGFCGVKPVNTLVFGSVKNSSVARREKWIKTAYAQGKKLKNGRITPLQKLAHKSRAWFKAIRIQFYLMTWIAYSIGALATYPNYNVFTISLFWLGYLCLFLLEVATVLINEIVDFKSDQINNYYSVFTGGSRVLVEKLLSHDEVKIGITIALISFLLASMVLIAITPAPILTITLILGLAAILALGYTAPPLKLCYRSLGELDVAVTHSIGVMLCGYVFLGGAWDAPLPWLLSMPLLLSIVPAITLSGIPDLTADAAAAKRTLAVRFGQYAALTIALVFTLLAAASIILLPSQQLLSKALAGTAYFVIPHAAILVWLLYKRMQSARLQSVNTAGRIDALMFTSLTYILWFGLIPLINLM